MIPGLEPTDLPLRDIHLPDSVSWWPPAPGWWLVLIVMLALGALLRWLVNRRRNQSESVAVQVQQELRRIRTEFAQHHDKARLARELSELLRRVCISLFPRQATASLTGQAWLAFLDSQMDSTHFSLDDGKVLIEAPYRNEVEFDDEKLMQLVEQWLQRVLAKQERTS